MIFLSRQRGPRVPGRTAAVAAALAVQRRELGHRKSGRLLPQPEMDHLPAEASLSGYKPNFEVSKECDGDIDGRFKHAVDVRVAS